MAFFLKKKNNHYVYTYISANFERIKLLLLRIRAVRRPLSIFLMTDLTDKFKSYLNIIQNGGLAAENGSDGHKGNESRTNKGKETERLRLQDSFIKECYDLLKSLTQLRKILKYVKPGYMNEDEMSEEEKDDVDTELRLQFQQYIQKFRLMEKYEHERQRLITEEFLSSKAYLKSLFQGINSEKLTLFHKANNEFRLGVLKSLSMWLNIFSGEFSSMQQERLDSQKKFEALDFNSGLQDVVSVTSVSQTPVVESTQEEVRNYEETVSKLTQEQLQLLQTEHEEMLNKKNEQLKKAEQLNKTIIDIVGIQHEISTHLQEQSQNINSVLDNQEDVELNIREGNKQLTKAKKSAGKAAKMTTYMAIIMGFMILFLDYIS